MNRRGFLKLFGLGAAALALPKTLLAFGGKATETIKASVEKIKTKFTPRKIKPVGKRRISAEYLANHCNCKQDENLMAQYIVNRYPKSRSIFDVDRMIGIKAEINRKDWKRTARITKKFLENTYNKWVQLIKKEGTNEHIS